MSAQFLAKKWSSEIHSVKYQSGNCLTNERENLSIFNNIYIKKSEYTNVTPEWMPKIFTLSTDNSDTRKKMGKYPIQLHIYCSNTNAESVLYSMGPAPYMVTELFAPLPPNCSTANLDC